MSANVDQRSKGQPNQVSNGSGKDVMKEDDPYLQAPVHSMRSWSEQTSDSPYGAPPMSNAGVSDSFFQNYYASNMTYPFMNQGIGGSEGPWSNGADTMFGMSYDYSSMYGVGGFGFPPFSNWEYASDYWGSSQPQRKDQRGGYPPHQEEAYYPPEMMPADSYGMMPNGVAAPVPPEPQEPIGTVEHGLRGMNLGGGGGGPMPPSSSMVESSSRKKMDLSHQPPSMSDNFGGHHTDSSHLMMQHPPPLTHAQPPQSQASPSSMLGGGSGSSPGGSSGGHSQPKKTSWAAIASQPARTQQQLRPRTIPRAPVNPNKPHSGNMDIGTWDNRGGNMAGKLPVQALQPPLSVSQAPPPPRAQSWAASSAPPPRATRQMGPPSSSSSTSNNTPPSSGASINSNMNNNSSNGTGSNNSGPPPSSHASSAYSNYTGGSGANSGHNSGSNGGSSNSSSNASSGQATMNGGHMPSGSSRESQQAMGNASGSGLNAAGNPVLDQLKYNNYNPKDFNLNPKSARFFIIKSYSEDDIHRSIKYSIWCSTEHGNKRLDQAFREREGKGPVYLIFSVNGSGHFCGIAQMMSPVDYNKSAGVWAQDKWKGQFTVKWVYVKDVPNNQLRHIRLENNENKPVTNSRDTQEVPAEKGKQVLRILHAYKHVTSIFDDFVHYEKRQLEDAAQASSHHHGHQQHRGNSGADHRGDGRGDGRGGDHRDHRDHRDRDNMGGRSRDNRRGGYDMGGRGGHDHRDGGRNHDHRGSGHHDSRGGRQN